jgi:DNA repair protein RecN (Recombination protein N)
MLRFLSVRRLAVIDSVEIEFDAGLNVLTGETGAGKSILVEAVGLLLGGRASGDLVRTGEETATVEAIFEREGQELVVRREVTAQGRSRAFVNGDLTTAGALKDLSSKLIELHGQHEHQTLMDPSTHLAVIDTYARLDGLRGPVASTFDNLRRAGEEAERHKRAAADRGARQDVVTFQLAELDRAALRLLEDDELTTTRHVLASAERVERLCAESYALLYERDDAVLATLGGVWRRVAELATIDPQFHAYVDSREEIKARLEDLALFLRQYASAREASPARLQQVEERLALIERLKRKYGPGLPEAIGRREALRRELVDLERCDERLVELDEQRQTARRAYLAAAERLSTARREAAARFVPQVEHLLGELAMERTQFDVRFVPSLPEDAWTADGLDRVELFVSPNPGEDLRPLARIVSGGELSRIMMAIKTLTATSRHGFNDAFERQPSPAAPGLIFDEVDAGIGGRIADVVGRKLRALGSAFQVLCITHLPQIAAYADTHFAIAKRVDRGRTKTTVARLDDAGRVSEISRMLGGEGITEAIQASAREMLDGRRSSGTGSQAKDEETSKGESETGRAKGPGRRDLLGVHRTGAATRRPAPRARGDKN